MDESTNLPLKLDRTVISFVHRQFGGYNSNSTHFVCLYPLM